MILLKKVRLVNWYGFANTTAPIGFFTLIAGQNGNGKSVMPRSLASDCSEQLPERVQLVHSESCCDSRNSTFVLRATRAFWLLVCTTMPSST